MLITSLSNIVPSGVSTLFSGQNSIAQALSGKIQGLGLPSALVTSFGVGVGLGLYGVYRSSRLITILHEVVGHTWLGTDFVHCFPKGKGELEFGSWNNLLAIGKERTLSGILAKTKNFVLGHEARNKRLNGTTREFNSLGKFLGKNLSLAWIAVAGPIPEIIVSSVLLTGGFSLFKASQKGLGLFLMSFALANYIDIVQRAIRDNFAKESDEKFGDFYLFAGHLAEKTGLPHHLFGVAATIAMMVSIPGSSYALYQIGSRLLR